MNAAKRCLACGWSRFYRRKHAGRTAIRQHRCVPQPVAARGCRPDDVEDQA